MAETDLSEVRESDGLAFGVEMIKITIRSPLGFNDVLPVDPEAGPGTLRSRIPSGTR
jgi:hypothetical protein